MTKVKVCGMTNLADAEHAASHGVWAIGLIHHPGSPRYVRPEVAEEIGAAYERLRGAGLPTAPFADGLMRAGLPAPPASTEGAAALPARDWAALKRLCG